jgi:beta-xylosidase
VIEAVMLWNEPNNLSHWNRDLDPNWERFAEMVRVAGERLAQAGPDLTRVLGGISPLDPSFIAHLFHLGVEDAVDVVAVHGFPFDWNHWHVDEWADRLQAVREVCNGKPIWAAEVGASSFVSPVLQAWALDQMAERLAKDVERVYWYALMDLPERWEAMTRHRQSEGSAYYRHFRMGVYDADGRPKRAAERLQAWTAAGVGVCEWVFWQEEGRLQRMIEEMRELGVRRLRTGIGWADWDRPGATEWFDHVIHELADFDLTLTLCFTPARLGLVPHHTSPPVDLSLFADFCEAVVRRYRPARVDTWQARSGRQLSSGSVAARPE